MEQARSISRLFPVWTIPHEPARATEFSGYTPRQCRVTGSERLPSQTFNLSLGGKESIQPQIITMQRTQPHGT